MVKTLIWWAPFCAGGLGDRILGMVSSCCIAKELDRKFLIKWDTQDMSDVFTIDQKYNYYTYNYPYTQVIHDNITSQTFYSNKQEIDNLERLDHILIWSNQNLFQYLYKNRPDEQEKYEKILFDTFALTFTEILHPINISLLPDLKNSVGIHIRTRDIHFLDQEKRYEHIPYITDILLRCKEHIEKTDEKIIFVASDCDLAYSLAQQIFGSKYCIIFNEGPIIHSMTNTEINGLKKVVTDLISMGECKSLYLGWNTNFPKVGALLNGRRKFYNFEHPSAQKCIYNFPAIELANYFSWGGRER